MAGNHWVGWTTPLRCYDVTVAAPRDFLVRSLAGARCSRVKTCFQWGNRHETKHNFHLSNDSHGIAVYWCLSEDWVVRDFPSVRQGAELKTELYLLNQQNPTLERMHKQDRTECDPTINQSRKHLGSRVALLPGKFLRVRKVFARLKEKK